jgi:long-chain acyl-CoA synthetase
MTHANILAIQAGLMSVTEFTSSDRTLSYLPLAHVAERSIIWYLLFKGGCFCVISGEKAPKYIKDDLEDCKPTVFLSVPRLYNKFYDKINAKLSGTFKKLGDKHFKPLTTFMNKLFEKALKRKEKRMLDNNCYKHWVYDKLFFDKVKMILGGNVRLMITGAAPINDDVKQFFKLAAGCRMHEAYGQTECTGISHTTD